jgi:hypothetical protein
MAKGRSNETKIISEVKTESGNDGSTDQNGHDATASIRPSEKENETEAETEQVKPIELTRDESLAIINLTQSGKTQKEAVDIIRSSRLKREAELPVEEEVIKLGALSEEEKFSLVCNLTSSGMSLKDAKEKVGLI